MKVIVLIGLSMLLVQLAFNQSHKERQEQIVELLKEITHDTNKR